MPHLDQKAFRKVTDTQAFGVAAITQELDGLRFPCTRQQVLARFRATPTVAWTRDQHVEVRELFDRIEADRFDDREALLDAVREAAAAAGLDPHGGDKTAGAEP